MRLGVCGMIPGEFVQTNVQDLEAIRALELSVYFHYAGDKMGQLSADDLRTVRQTFESVEMDLVQFGIGFGECLLIQILLCGRASLKRSKAVLR